MRGRLMIGAVIVGLALAASCRKEVPAGGGEESETAAGAYDPAKDPLVNPPQLLEIATDDRLEEVNQDEVLIRILDANPINLNPIFSSSTYEMYISDLLFDGLFSFDAEMKWFVNDHMVESFEESDDHLTHTVKLKPGLKWHDGQPWTAHDIRFSWEVILDDRVPAPAVKSGTDQIADVRVIDDLTVQFVHKEALPTNIWNMLFPVVPKHIYGNPEKHAEDPSLRESEYYNHYNREEIIGNGPYRFVEWITNDRIMVERWDDFHGDKPHFKRQLLKIQLDPNVALLVFKRGEADEIRLSSQQFATQTNDEEYAAVGVKGFASEWSFSYIGWNMDGSNPFFNDRKVRRALAHAINIPNLLRTIFYNLDTQAHGVYHPDSWMYNPDTNLLDYDLDKAAALLDEAGWKVSDDDGWRYKTINGVRVKFDFELLIPRESLTSPKVAALFAEDLKKVGVSLVQRMIEWATFQQMTRTHEFQAQIAAWGTGADPDTGWNLWRTEEYEDGRNYGGYSNARVDELFQLARREFDVEKRAHHYGEIQKLIYEDQPYLFLVNRAVTWGFHKRLRGITFSPRGVFNFDPSVRGWWVHKSDQMRID